MGIWTVVDQYFWSWYVRVDLQHLVEFGKIFFELPTHWKTPLWFPLPGGKLIGGLMFINLLAAHFVQFLNLVVSVSKEVGRRSPWSAILMQMLKKTGIYILHGGLLLLFVGEYITREFQVEQQMHIREGGSADFAIDTRNHELAFLRTVDPTTSRVTVVPSTKLRAARDRIVHDELPVDIEVVRYMVNSDLVDPTGENPATAGAGRTAMAIDLPEVSGVDVTSKMDVPSAYVRLFNRGTGETLGTYLVTLFFDRPQKITVDGTEYEIQLRNTRYYKPFTLHLIDFRFDRYLGTGTAKNYSSAVRLVDSEMNQDRELTISMNEPLRHRGETFYQSSFFPDEKGTILSVVRNPGWMLPYIACALVTLGMLIHFGIYLTQFLVRMLRGRLGTVAGLRQCRPAAAIPLRTLRYPRDHGRARRPRRAPRRAPALQRQDEPPRGRPAARRRGRTRQAARHHRSRRSPPDHACGAVHRRQQEEAPGAQLVLRRRLRHPDRSGPGRRLQDLPHRERPGPRPAEAQATRGAPLLRQRDEGPLRRVRRRRQEGPRPRTGRQEGPRPLRGQDPRTAQAPRDLHGSLAGARPDAPAARRRPRMAHLRPRLARRPSRMPASAFARSLANSD